jgi:hypothetical protein
LYPYISPNASPKTAAGIVLADGSVYRGSGFTVAHPTEGHYVITFSPSFFPTGCAAMSVEPFSREDLVRYMIGEVTIVGCERHNPVFNVRLWRDIRIPADKEFSFIVVGV